MFTYRKRNSAKSASSVVQPHITYGECNLVEARKRMSLLLKNEGYAAPFNSYISVKNK